MHPQGNRQTASGQWLRRSDLLNFINTMYDGDLHAKRVLSLANATLGVLTSASLAIHAVGRGLAQAMGTLTKHGVKQVDRLLSNRGVNVWTFFAYWTPYIVGARSEVVVALDWTSFAADEQETIVLSMLTGHGRATPLLWKTVASSTLKGNQRRYEYEVLCRLREVLPAGVKVTVVADRGFADCKLFYALTTELGFEYVIRLRGDIYVTNARGERRVAAAWVGAGGRARRLVGARVTDAHEMPVGAVVCVHDAKMDEPWCLVARMGLRARLPCRCWRPTCIASGCFCRSGSAKDDNASPDSAGSCKYYRIASRRRRQGVTVLGIGHQGLSPALRCPQLAGPPPSRPDSPPKSRPRSMNSSQNSARNRGFLAGTRRYGMTGSQSCRRRARARDKVAEAAYDSRVDTSRGVRAADEGSRS